MIKGKHARGSPGELTPKVAHIPGGGQIRQTREYSLKGVCHSRGLQSKALPGPATDRNDRSSKAEKTHRKREWLGGQLQMVMVARRGP